jgi:hypothetical protein
MYQNHSTQFLICANDWCLSAVLILCICSSYYFSSFQTYFFFACTQKADVDICPQASCLMPRNSIPSVLTIVKLGIFTISKDITLRSILVDESGKLVMNAYQKGKVIL